MANITVSSSEDMSIVNISDFMDLAEYYRKFKKVDACGVINMLTDNVILNNRPQKVNKGLYYIFQVDDKLYNVYVGEYIAVDERYKSEDIEYEKIIRYSSFINAYRYQEMEHHKNGTTSNIKSYDNNIDTPHEQTLSKEEAYKLIDDMLTNLIKIDKIRNIFDVELMKENILTALGNDKVLSHQRKRRGARK